MLSLRLESLSKFVSFNDSVIDIGCDHALLDIFLVENNIVKNMIVSDINEDALEQGKKNIKKAGLSDQIEARLGHGFEVLTEDDKIDTVIISGMGTRTMLNILEDDYLEHINKLILQSNNDHALLRSELVNKGFMIKNEEYLIDNGKSYINIVFVRGNKKYTKEEIEYGPILMHNKPYIESEKDNIRKIMNIVPKEKFMIKHRMKKELKTLDKLTKK